MNPRVKRLQLRSGTMSSCIIPEEPAWECSGCELSLIDVRYFSALSPNLELVKAGQSLVSCFLRFSGRFDLGVTVLEMHCWSRAVQSRGLLPRAAKLRRELSSGCI